MIITYCDNCDTVVDHSEDSRRFMPYTEKDGKVICYDCVRVLKMRNRNDSY